MKILILGSKEYPVGTNTDDILPSGGIEVYVQDMISHLSKSPKIEIVVITRRFSKTLPHEKTENAEIFRVPWLKGFFFRNISFNFMGFLMALRIDFNLIYSNGPISAFFGLILSRIKKIPIIASPLGLALQQPQYNMAIKTLFSVLENFVYSRVDWIIFSSEQEKDGFKKKLGFLPERYKIIHPGIDVKGFENGDREKIKKRFSIEDRKVIAFVGRLIEVKGLKYLIEAVKHLKSDALVLIVGDGIQRKELEALVLRLKLENVIFTGRVSSIPDVLAATDIFVLPSLSEGLPIALLEAMAAGKACVVTNIGLPVEDMIDALVVDAGNSSSIAKALQGLLDNEELRRKLGGNAKKKAVNEFSWENAVKSYLNLFEELHRTT